MGEGGDWPEVVDAFIADNDAQTVAAARRELDQLLPTDAADAELDHILDTLGCSTSPTVAKPANGSSPYATASPPATEPPTASAGIDRPGSRVTPRV